MSKNETSQDFPTYNEVMSTPRPEKMWQPYLDDGKRSKAELAVANGAFLLSILLVGGACVGIYAAALGLINIFRDVSVDMLPGCSTLATITGIALKVLATVAIARLMKICWDSIPYLVTKLREETDDVFR